VYYQKSITSHPDYESKKQSSLSNDAFNLRDANQKKKERDELLSSQFDYKLKKFGIGVAEKLNLDTVYQSLRTNSTRDKNIQNVNFLHSKPGEQFFEYFIEKAGDDCHWFLLIAFLNTKSKTKSSRAPDR
jgi:hypothetical protein